MSLEIVNPSPQFLSQNTMVTIFPKIPIVIIIIIVII